MRFPVLSFRAMSFRAPPGVPGAPPGDAAADSDAPTDPHGFVGRDWDIGHPTAASQQAGLDHLIRIAMEQAAAEGWPAPEGTWTSRAEQVRGAAPGTAVADDGPGEAPGTLRHS
jgi:hypothetical protein